MERKKSAVGSRAWSWAFNKLPQLTAILFWLIVSVAVGWSTEWIYGVILGGGLVVGLLVVWVIGLIIPSKSKEETTLDTFHEYKNSTDAIIAKRERIKSTYDVIVSYSQLQEFILRTPENMNRVITMVNDIKESQGEATIPKVVADG